MAVRYVIVRDDQGRVLAMGKPEHCAIVERDERERDLFQGFWDRAVAEGDAQTIYRNADRELTLDQLDGIPFIEVGKWADSQRVPLYGPTPDEERAFGKEWADKVREQANR